MTSVASSANPSLYGQSVTLTATVSPVAPGFGTPTGSVTFYDGSTTLGTAVLSKGVAKLVTKTLAAGSHAIKAVYSGDAGFAGSKSSVLTQTVNSDATSTSLTSSLNPSSLGQAVTFTANVSVVAPGSGIPSGTVTFYDGSTPLATVTLRSASAKFTTKALAAGGHSITAVYNGDSNIQGSTSPVLVQTVNSSSSMPVYLLSPHAPPSSPGALVAVPRLLHAPLAQGLGVASTDVIDQVLAIFAEDCSGDGVVPDLRSRAHGRGIPGLAR
jgi:hypothetical protein